MCGDGSGGSGEPTAQQCLWRVVFYETVNLLKFELLGSATRERAVPRAIARQPLRRLRAVKHQAAPAAFLLAVTAAAAASGARLLVSRPSKSFEKAWLRRAPSRRHPLQTDV